MAICPSIAKTISLRSLSRFSKFVLSKIKPSSPTFNTSVKSACFCLMVSKYFFVFSHSIPAIISLTPLNCPINPSVVIISLLNIAFKEVVRRSISPLSSLTLVRSPNSFLICSVSFSFSHSKPHTGHFAFSPVCWFRSSNAFVYNSITSICCACCSSFLNPFIFSPSFSNSPPILF